MDEVMAPSALQVGGEPGARLLDPGHRRSLSEPTRRREVRSRHESLLPLCEEGPSASPKRLRVDTSAVVADDISSTDRHQPSNLLVQTSSPMQSPPASPEPFECAICSGPMKDPAVGGGWCACARSATPCLCACARLVRGMGGNWPLTLTVRVRPLCAQRTPLLLRVLRELGESQVELPDVPRTRLEHLARRRVCQAHRRRVLRLVSFGDRPHVRGER